jgi:hypothetical protein
MPGAGVVRVSYIVCTVAGETGKVKTKSSRARSTRVDNGFLFNKGWSYASEWTQRDLIAAARFRGNARMGLKISHKKGVKTRISRVGPCG